MDRILPSATTSACSACCVSASPVHPSSHKTHLESSDAVGPQPGTGYFDQGFNYNLVTQQLLEPISSGGLGGGTEAFPGVENSGQAATPWQLDTGMIHQAMDHDQGTPVPTPQSSLPLTAAPVETDATTK